MILETMPHYNEGKNTKIIFFNLQRGRNCPRAIRSMTSVCPAKRKVSKSNPNQNFLVLTHASPFLISLHPWALNALGFWDPGSCIIHSVHSFRTKLPARVRNFLINSM